MINLETLSNDNLKKLVAKWILLEDVYDECGACGRPKLLHKEGTFTQTEKEPPDVVNVIWTDLKQIVKPILREERKKEAEQSLLLDGIKCLITNIHGQNTLYMNLYNKSMTVLV